MLEQFATKLEEKNAACTPSSTSPIKRRTAKKQRTINPTATLDQMIFTQMFTTLREIRKVLQGWKKMMEPVAGELYYKHNKLDLYVIDMTEMKRIDEGLREQQKSPNSRNSTKTT